MENDLVEIRNDKVVTTSKIIADTFVKEHKNVLAKIEEKKGLFTGLNFKLSEYTDSTGRKLPMYLLDRDFTTYLIMGFTGAKADEWKLKYIKAFNTMESMLKDMGKSEYEWLEAGSIESIKKFVAYGIGVAILPLFVMEKEVTDGLFHQVKLDEDIEKYFDYRIQLAYEKNRWISPAIEKFCEISRKCLRSIDRQI